LNPFGNVRSLKEIPMRLSRSVPAVLLVCGAAATAQPVNDSCASAEPISGFTVVPFDNSLATTDGIANSLCNFFSQQNIDLDVWYRWTPSQAGPTRLTTCGQTTIDSKIAVYEGTACPEGKGIIACSDDNCSTQTTVSWTAVAGRTYLIRVGNYPGTTGGVGSFTIESGIVAGPIVNPSNGHSYFLLSPSTWTAGQAAAVVMGGHLATVRSPEENEFLRASVLGFDGLDRRGWIGLNDVALEGSFVWASGEPVVYTNWNGGEPSNSGGNEHYVEMFGSNGLWNDNANTPGTLSVFPIVEIGGAACVCYPNCDGSTTPPTLNVQDFGCFLNAFASGDPYANCDGSTTPPVLNVQDFGCFLNAFSSGCSC
jgi:hypothetical protein